VRPCRNLDAGSSHRQRYDLAQAFARRGRMDGLLRMEVPWWEVVLRGVVVFAVLMALIRLSGKRTVGQFTPFDLLVLVLLGDAVQGSMIAGDESLQGGLLLAFTLLACNQLVGFATARSRRLEVLV